MRVALLVGAFSSLFLTGCFFEANEDFIFECRSSDGQYAAELVSVSGGGAAGARYLKVFVKRLNGKDFKSQVAMTSTSNKLIMEWDERQNLTLIVDNNVKIHSFKNYFDESKYWKVEGGGAVFFRYKNFAGNGEVSQCIN